MNILNDILQSKKLEVHTRKQEISIRTLEERDLFSRETNSLKHRIISSTNRPSIVSEFKRKSPSKGYFNKDADVMSIVKGYMINGASALSILTDRSYFGGGLSDLGIARRVAPSLPILRKDFMIDEYQLIEAKAWGADAVLLIASILSKQDLKSLSKVASMLGLDTVLEVHSQEELEEKYVQGIDVIGVNNRNLKTFEVSIETSLNLISHISSEVATISESGVENEVEAIRLWSAGYQGILVGELFMKDESPPRVLNKFLKKIDKALHQ